MNRWHERVAADPNVCHGKPCIRGTRVLVSIILDNLAKGMSHDEVVREDPPLTLDDVSAALAYAAALAREQELVPLR
jgi:uncharacterized protein (DUF433 family)